MNLRKFFPSVEEALSYSTSTSVQQGSNPMGRALAGSQAGMAEQLEKVEDLLHSVLSTQGGGNTALVRIISKFLVDIRPYKGG